MNNNNVRKELKVYQKETDRLYHTSPIPMKVVKRYLFLSLLHCLKMKCPPNSAICRTSPSEMNSIVSTFMGKKLTERQMIDTFKNLISSGDIEKLATGIYWIDFTVPESCEETFPKFQTPSWAYDKTIPMKVKEIIKEKSESLKKLEPKQDKPPKIETCDSDAYTLLMDDVEEYLGSDQDTYTNESEDFEYQESKVVEF